MAASPVPAPRALRLRILAWRLRRVTASVALLVAALLVARTLAPPPEPTAPVIVLARDVPADRPLSEADLRTVRLPAPCTRDALTSGVVGRTLAVPLPAGAELTTAVLAGERFAVDPPDGTVVVPVRLADGSATGLLRPGDRIDLVRATDLGLLPQETAAEGSTVLARAALVVEVGAGTPDEGGLGLSAGAGGDPLVLVAVSPAEGHGLASTSGGPAVGAVLVG